MSRYIAKKIGPLRARPLSHAAATIIFQCRISSDLRWRMTPPVDLDPIPFDPVPTAARHDGWTPARQRDFIDALGKCGLVAAAAREVGMTPKSAYRLRARADAESFAAAWDVACDRGRAVATDTAIERAMEGVAAPVFHGGLQVGERRATTIACSSPRCVTGGPPRATAPSRSPPSSVRPSSPGTYRDFRALRFCRTRSPAIAYSVIFVSTSAARANLYAARQVRSGTMSLQDRIVGAALFRAREDEAMKRIMIAAGLAAMLLGAAPAIAAPAGHAPGISAPQDSRMARRDDRRDDRDRRMDRRDDRRMDRRDDRRDWNRGRHYGWDRGRHHGWGNRCHNARRHHRWVRICRR